MAYSYHGHRFPPELITRAVLLYKQRGLSYRQIEEHFAEQGIKLTDETVRRWVAKFGDEIAGR